LRYQLFFLGCHPDFFSPYDQRLSFFPSPILGRRSLSSVFMDFHPVCLISLPFLSLPEKIFFFLTTMVEYISTLNKSSETFLLLEDLNPNMELLRDLGDPPVPLKVNPNSRLA